MRCYVYRSSRKPETYLYLPVKGDVSGVPEALMALFGRPEFTLEFELHPHRRLAREDPMQVLRDLEERGFHLQIPPQNERPY